MKKLTLTLVVGLLAITATGAVKADPVAGSRTTAASAPFTIKLGYGEFTNGGNQGVFMVSGDYAFEKSAANSNPVLPSVYADYFDNTAHGGTGLFGAGVAVRQYASAPGSSSTAPYYGVGIGGYWPTSGNSSTYFGAKVLGGVEFDSNWLAELNYTWINAAGNPGVFAGEVGYRF